MRCINKCMILNYLNIRNNWYMIRKEWDMEYWGDTKKFNL